MRRHSIRGFTLLEVIFAVALLAIAVLGFYQGQASSIRLAQKSEKRLQAMQIAQRVMTQTEIDLRKKSFAAFPDEEKGKPEEEELKNFEWTRTFEKFSVHCLPGQWSGDSEEGNTSSPQSGFGQAAQFLEQAIRKIKVTVSWEEGGKPLKTELTQLYIRYEDLPKF